ncbi:MAG: caspase family protein, partial [Armatimonadetes bacterium]|nr:caspase family protein [Armatimonadota bacterium]
MRALCALAIVLAAHAGAATWIVAVGVEKYQDSGSIQNLKYADEDVIALCDAFRGAGVPDDHIALLVSGATDPLLLSKRECIVRSLEAFAIRAVAGDTFIFIFSGHGMSRGNETFLLTYDCRWAQVDADALAMRRVHQALRGLLASNVLFIIDACRNDPEAGKSQQDATLDEGMVKGVRPVAYAPPGQTVNAALLMACGIGERAWEMDETRHGTFTFFLLQGLKARYLRENGALRLGELANFVSSKVPEWCKVKQHKLQTPLLDLPEGSDFTIVPAGLAGEKVTRVEVYTEPAGSKVFVKGPNETTGRDVGPSPCKVDVLPGADSQITVVQAGYAKEEHRFRLDCGQRWAWWVVLQPDPP